MGSGAKPAARMTPGWAGRGSVWKRRKVTGGGGTVRAGCTHVNGAAQEGPPLQGLEDDLVEVAGCLA